MDKSQEPTVAISLTTLNTAEALDFYTRAFNAKELYRMPTPDGGIAHAEFTIGNTRIFISDESEEYSAKAMPEGSIASCLFSILAENCKDAHQQAVNAGATSLHPPEDKFYGARIAVLLDPYGYRWCITQHIEELSPEEIQKRASELFGS